MDSIDNKRFFIFVVLSGAILFSWQYFFSPPPVETKDPIVKVESPNTQTNTASTASDGKTSEAPKLDQGTVTASPVIALQRMKLTNENHSFEFNSDLSDFLPANPNSVFPFVELADNKSPVSFWILTETGLKKVNFSSNQISADKIEIRDDVLGISGTASLDNKGKLIFKLHSQKPTKISVHLTSKEKTKDNGQIRDYLLFSNDLTRFHVGKSKDGEGDFKWLGLDFNYHVLSVVFGSKLHSKYVSKENGELELQTIKDEQNFEFYFVYTKKNYDHLISLGDNLHFAVDFGFFAVLAVPLLRGLQFVYKYIPNYGIAIILLTIFIRLLTFPLQYKSFKSMKKMQELQPELQKIKDKYKDDAQKMQKETMELFKKAGANPLSGCLPLLLQMPFFFAIYKVLYSAVELVGAPFYFWITDLSIQDPYYVLPVLMAASMFLQQKMTPQTTMDPTQQKVMLLMPIIFGFIMKSLPAGLVLYIFVSTIVGILQQYIVNKALD